MAVNQKQIAEQVGVSISLVSRVLSGNAREIGIAESTIERVLEIAKEMDYVPNVAARMLKGKASKTIGVVVYDFQDPFFGSMIEQLQSVVHEQGYSLVLAGFQGRHPEVSDLAPLHKHVIDGLVVLGSADDSDWLDHFRKMPVVRVGHGTSDERSACVTIDEADAARQLLEHLSSRGLLHSTFIGSDLFVHELRYEALKHAAGDLGMKIAKLNAPSGGFSGGFQVTAELLKDATSASALVCATDMIAMGALHALHDAGLRWPVTGFDDIPAAQQFIPSITTIRQPIEDIVKHAFEAVTQPNAPAEILLPGKLIVRSSS